MRKDNVSKLNIFVNEKSKVDTTHTNLELRKRLKGESWRGKEEKCNNEDKTKATQRQRFKVS